jgi:hypothetical protein
VTSRRRLALWIAAIGLAVGGNVLYLLAMNDWAWWVGIALAMPLAVLLVLRLPDWGGGGMGDGPWGAP